MESRLTLVNGGPARQRKKHAAGIARPKVLGGLRDPHCAFTSITGFP